jgi:hypothetical protein
VSDAPIVDLADPAARAAWLATMRTDAEDLITAALDATAPPGERMLGRRAAREHVTDAARGLRDALDAAGAPKR